jgi:hypothetical protein
LLLLRAQGCGISGGGQKQLFYLLRCNMTGGRPGQHCYVATSGMILVASQLFRRMFVYSTSRNDSIKFGFAETIPCSSK